MKEAVKPAYFVPESVKADVLFQRMQQSRNHFAVVLDEYGGMNGIITMTDLLECIVGDLYEDDDIETPEQDIETLDSGTFRISGAASLDDVEEALELKLDAEDCDTFGGYVMGLLGVIPEDGSTVSVETDALSIKVTKIKDHKIEQMIVCKLSPAAETSKKVEAGEV